MIINSFFYATKGGQEPIIDIDEFARENEEHMAVPAVWGAVAGGVTAGEFLAQVAIAAGLVGGAYATQAAFDAAADPGEAMRQRMLQTQDELAAYDTCRRLAAEIGRFTESAFQRTGPYMTPLVIEKPAPDSIPPAVEPPSGPEVPWEIAAVLGGAALLYGVKGGPIDLPERLVEFLPHRIRHDIMEMYKRRFQEMSPEELRDLYKTANGLLREALEELNREHRLGLEDESGISALSVMMSPASASTRFNPVDPIASAEPPPHSGETAPTEPEKAADDRKEAKKATAVEEGDKVPAPRPFRLLMGTNRVEPEGGHVPTEEEDREAFLRLSLGQAANALRVALGSTEAGFMPGLYETAENEAAAMATARDQATRLLKAVQESRPEVFSVVIWPIRKGGRPPLLADVFDAYRASASRENTSPSPAQELRSAHEQMSMADRGSLRGALQFEIEQHIQKVCDDLRRESGDIAAERQMAIAATHRMISFISEAEGKIDNTGDILTQDPALPILKSLRQKMQALHDRLEAFEGTREKYSDAAWALSSEIRQLVIEIKSTLGLL